MICPICDLKNQRGAQRCQRCNSSFVLASRYAMLETLGRGGMGLVYRARDLDLDETVALKLIRADLVDDPVSKKRFRSEIKLARRVSHPNVCRIHELGREGSLSYIVMECVEGVDLRRILRERGRLPPAEAFDIALQICDALHAIHAEGIVHRDLKTPNVMLNARNVVKLMDFGIARSLESGSTGATAAGHIVGTPEYMSPEQARAGKLDFRSDIYALGIVVFELFTGEVPFRGDTPIATLFMHIQDPPPLEGTRDLPSPLIPVLRKALAKAPDDRFQSASEFGQALRAARAQSFPDGVPTWTPAPTRSAAAPVADLPPETTPVPTPVPTPAPTPVPTPVPTAVPTEVPARRPGRATPVRPRPAARLAMPVPSRPPRGKPSVATVAGAAILIIVGIGTVLVVPSLRGPKPAQDPAAVEPRPPGMTLMAPAATEPPAPTTLAARVETPAPVAVERTTVPPSPTAKPAPKVAPGAVASTETPIAAPSPRSPRALPSTRPTLSLRAIPQPSVSTAPTASPSASGPIPSPQGPGTGTASPEPPASTAETGTLRVVVVPWAEVEVDGVKRGVSPPLKPLALAPGVHAVRLTHPDYLPFPRKVTIRPGETTKLEVDLTKEAFPK